MNSQLLLIDPQNDFCNPNGTLFVPGAHLDVNRINKFITSNIKNLSEVHVTMDSHRLIDVAHPIFWVNSNGNHPEPFTIISVEDVNDGAWTTTNPSWRQKGLDYVTALASNGRYPLCIWPPHCMIGTWGHSIASEVSKALMDWQEAKFEPVNFISKGSNIFTEHYSAIKADVVDPLDKSTGINKELIQSLVLADKVFIAGEALSHCVANTVIDIIDFFDKNDMSEHIEKLTLLEDACSNVTGFEANGQKFISDMSKKGMKLAKIVN